MSAAATAGSRGGRPSVCSSTRVAAPQPAPPAEKRRPCGGSRRGVKNVKGYTNRKAMTEEEKKEHKKAQNRAAAKRAYARKVAAKKGRDKTVAARRLSRPDDVPASPPPALVDSGEETEEETESSARAQASARPALMPMDVLLPVSTRVAQPTAKWQELMMMTGKDWSPAQARGFMQKCQWPKDGGDEKWQKEVWKEILLLSASCGYIEKMHRDRPYLRLHPSPQLFARILKTLEWEAGEKNGYSEGSRSWAKHVQTLVHGRSLYLVYRYTLELPSNGSAAREALEEKMRSAKMDPAVVGQANGQSYAGITGVMYDDEGKIKDVTYVDPAQTNRETKFTASEQQRLQAFASEQQPTLQMLQSIGADIVEPRRYRDHVRERNDAVVDLAQMKFDNILREPTLANFTRTACQVLPMSGIHGFGLITKCLQYDVEVAVISDGGYYKDSEGALQGLNRNKGGWGGWEAAHTREAQRKSGNTLLRRNGHTILDDNAIAALQRVETLMLYSDVRMHPEWPKLTCPHAIVGALYRGEDGSRLYGIKQKNTIQLLPVCKYPFCESKPAQRVWDPETGRHTFRKIKRGTACGRVGCSKGKKPTKCGTIARFFVHP